MNSQSLANVASSCRDPGINFGVSPVDSCASLGKLTPGGCLFAPDLDGNFQILARSTA